MTDYYKFCERYAQRCAARRAELQEHEPALPQRQRSGEELVYKTFNSPASQPQVDQWAGWNAWADSRIAKFLDENLFTENQREALGYVIADLRQEWLQDIDQKLGELRAEVEVLRGVVKSNNVELIKRSSNVA